MKSPTLALAFQKVLDEHFFESRSNGSWEAPYRHTKNKILFHIIKTHVNLQISRLCYLLRAYYILSTFPALLLFSGNSH